MAWYWYDFGIDITANTVRERSLLYVDDNGNVDFEDYAGEPGYPEFNIFSRMYMELGDWRVSWQTNFLSRVDQDQEDSLDDCEERNLNSSSFDWELLLESDMIVII